MTTIFGGDLRTGEILVRNIPASSAGVTVEVNKAGTIDCSLRWPMIDPYTSAATDIGQLLIPGRSFLGFDEGGKILNAGPIWADSYDFDAGKLTYRAGGLWSYYNWRFVLPVLTAGQLPRDVSSTWTTSLRTQAKRLVEQAHAWTGGALPVILEADFAGTNERTYPGSDLVRVDQALTNLTGVDDGPDIAFRPEYKDSRHIQWRMVTGDPLLKQAGTDHVWDTTVPGSSVKGTTLDRDATTLATHDYESGVTVSDVQLQALATDAALTDAGYPMFETSSSRSSVSELPTLQSYANAAVVRGRSPVETLGLSVHRSLTPKLGTYDAGDFARIVLKASPFHPKGRYRFRLMGLSADLGDFVKLSLAPERDLYPLDESGVKGTAWLSNQLKRLSDAVEESNRGK